MTTLTTDRVRILNNLVLHWFHANATSFRQAYDLLATQYPHTGACTRRSHCLCASQDTPRPATARLWRTIGLNLQRVVQPSPHGHGQTFLIREAFTGNNSSAQSLGGYIFYGHDLHRRRQKATALNHEPLFEGCRFIASPDNRLRMRSLSSGGIVQQNVWIDAEQLQSSAPLPIKRLRPASVKSSQGKRILMSLSFFEKPDVIQIEPKYFGNARGLLLESVNQNQLETSTGKPVRFTKDNHSRSIENSLGCSMISSCRNQNKLARVVRRKELPDA